jgi:hypothetical protein
VEEGSKTRPDGRGLSRMLQANFGELPFPRTLVNKSDRRLEIPILCRASFLISLRMTSAMVGIHYRLYSIRSIE